MTDSAGGVAAADAVAVPAEKAPLPNPRAASAEPAATKPFARLRSLAAPHRGLYFKSILLAVAGVACGFLPYVAVANIATALIAGTTDLAFYLGWCALAAAGQVAKAFLSGASTTTSHRATFAVLSEVRRALAAKLDRMPLGYVLETPSGKLKAPFVERAEQLEVPLAHVVPEMTANLLVPLGIIAVIFALDWRMGLASLVTIPIGMLCYAVEMRDYAEKYGRVVAAKNHMGATIVEYIGGIEVIKAFGRSASSYAKFTDAVKANSGLMMDWSRTTLPWTAIMMSVWPSVLLGVLPVGLALYLAGDVTPAELGLEFVLALAVVAPLMKLSSFLNEAKAMEYAVADASEFLDLPELPEPAQRAAVRDEGVELANVSFSYESGEEVLHDVSLRVPRGSFCALVGPSGSGKSTLARLIARHWDVGAGAVRVGGVDVRDMPLDQLSQLVSFVAQDNYLFDCSLRENIRMGKPDATDDEVLAAARAACCDDFIGRLPHGYDTPAGEAGHALSGGERQRISIARAILKDAPIVVLDEATAFTDPENEERIQQSIARLTRGKTLLVIAHRLSTVAAADDIAVVDHGRIVAHGTHDRLLAACPLYASMWQAHVCAKAWSAVSRKEALDA